MLIVSPAVPHSEFGELRVYIKAQEGTVLCWGDTGKEDTGGGGGGDGLEVARFDVACRANVKNADLAVLRGGKVCAAAKAVAREHKELVAAEGVDLGLSGGTGLAAGSLGGLSGEERVSIQISGKA